MYQKIGSIVFSSDFDSGNLGYVEQVNDLFYRYLTLISR